jgi:hypothetical protein
MQARVQRVVLAAVGRDGLIDEIAICAQVPAAVPRDVVRAVELLVLDGAIIGPHDAVHVLDGVPFDLTDRGRAVLEP